MNIVDSSGWLAFFSDGEHADKFIEPLKKREELLVPVIIIYEVFKVVAREKGEREADRISRVMEKGELINLDYSLAILAAQRSHQHKLPMVDSIILATARHHEATIWTLDSDFKNIEGVNYFSKRGNG